MNNSKYKILISIIFIGAFIGCNNSNNNDLSKISGKVKIDGSSTVFPITEAVAEEFGKENKHVRVTVGVSGTGGGFKKFCIGEIDINDASRQIKDKEINICIQNNIEYIEIPVAYDGLSVVINNNNNWVDYLTRSELNAIWKVDSKIKYWSDIRENWPKQPIKLYGPGTDSGTFDYFKEVIIGKKNKIRSDFTKSEDDNVLVNGVSGSKYAMAFFGYAYYKENSDKLKVIPIDDGYGPISPTEKSINDGSYSPLSRPIFVYVNKESTKKIQVDSFMSYYIEKAPELVGEVGYIPLPQSLYDKAMQVLNNRRVGKWN